MDAFLGALSWALLWQAPAMAAGIVAGGGGFIWAIVTWGSIMDHRPRFGMALLAVALVGVSFAILVAKNMAGAG